MEKCKFCSEELEEGSTVCPHCGKDNAELTEQETPVTETETVVETAEETAPAQEETAEVTEEAAPEAAKKATPGKIALAVGAVVVLLAILIALIAAGVGGSKTEESVPTEEAIVATIPADGDPSNVTCKGSYTVTDEEAAAARDTVIATIEGNELTNGLLQVHYWSAVNSFLSSEQGYYVMMYGGVDPAQPLDTQRCMLDDTKTWQQYFLQQALDSWQISCGLAAEAQKAGMEMTQEQKDFVDGIEGYLEETAASFDISVEELMSRNVGSGAGVKEFAQFQTMYTKGSGYYAAQVENLVPTDAELEAFFDEHADGYAQSGVTKDGKFVDVRHILVTVKEDEAEETTAETAETTDAWKTCEEEAQAILDTWLAGEKTEESFAALANEKSEDPGSNTNGGLYEKVYEGQMVKPFEDWCFDESRKTGDYGLVKTDYGYHVMYFVNSAPQWKFYAERDWHSTKIGEMLTELAENYPMEVEYSNIVIGNLKTAE